MHSSQSAEWTMFFTRKKKRIVQLELQMMFYDVWKKWYAQSMAMKVCEFRAKIPTIFSCLQLIASSSLCEFLRDIWLEETMHKAAFFSYKSEKHLGNFCIFHYQWRKLKKVGKTTVEEGQSKWDISSFLYFLSELTQDFFHRFCLSLYYYSWSHWSFDSKSFIFNCTVQNKS